MFQESISLARKRAKHNFNVEFLEGSEKKLIIPNSDRSIDIIHSMGVLHHIENISDVFKEFRKS